MAYIFLDESGDLGLSPIFITMHIATKCFNYGKKKNKKCLNYSEDKEITGRFNKRAGFYLSNIYVSVREDRLIL